MESPDGTLATCVSGFGNTIQYNLAGRGVSLPDRVIIALAYDTQTYGEHPIGTDGPYNSLNVALFGAPTVGSLPRPNDGYWDTQTAGNYCDGGASGVVGVFRLDAGCWNTGSALDFVPDQPAVRVDASTTSGPQGPTGPEGPTGPQGGSGAAGPDRVEWWRRRCGGQVQEVQEVQEEEEQGLSRQEVQEEEVGRLQ